MTGVAGRTDAQLRSPAAERVRVTIRTDSSQADVCLPLDVPVAVLTRGLVQLLDESKAPESPSSHEPAHTVWSITRSGTAVSPDETLREAAVADGDLLRLTAEPELVAPTHYDDVVEAAARLTTTRYPAWSPVAARNLAFAGIYLICFVWAFFLLSSTFTSSRDAVVGLSAVNAVGLAGGAVLSSRSFGRDDIGVALGWAAVPVMTAIVWTVLSPHGGYALAAGCGGLVAVTWGVQCLTGVGRGGFLAACVVFAAGGLLSAAHAAGVSPVLLGAVASALATLGSTAVQRFPARADGTTAAAPDPWSSSASSATLRVGIYVGLALTAGIGCAMTCAAAGAVTWPVFLYTLTCAAALVPGAESHLGITERAAVLVPVITLVAGACALAARTGAPPIPLVALTVLLVVGVASVVIGTGRWSRQARRRAQVFVAYARYAVTAALVPLLLWVVGALSQLGVS